VSGEPAPAADAVCAPVITSLIKLVKDATRLDATKKTRFQRGSARRTEGVARLVIHLRALTCGASSTPLDCRLVLVESWSFKRFIITISSSSSRIIDILTWPE